MSTSSLLVAVKAFIIVLAILAALVWLVLSTLGWGISQLEFAPDTAISFPLTLLSGWGIILVVALVPFALIKLAEANAREKIERNSDEPLPPSDPLDSETE